MVLGILNDPTRVDHTFASVARTVSDARIMLKKNEERYTQAQVIFAHCKENDPKVPGPIHGLMEKLGLARSQVYLKPNGELHIKTPLGADVAIRTPHGTHLKEVIKEACRFSAIQHLCDRIDENKTSEGDRQDMKGISPYVDTLATMALSRAKLKVDEEHGSEEETPDLGDNQACPEAHP